MSLLAAPAPAGAIELDLLAHLDHQLASARRLLHAVLEQGAAIRRRDVDGVLARLADIQAEMARRSQLEQDRAQLLMAAGAALGLPAPQVTLEQLITLVSPAAARAAVEKSAELRGLLGEIAREHGINRALMRQELAFLSHLTRLLGQEPETGYRPPAGGGGVRPASGPGDRPAAAHRVLDLQA